MNTIWNPHDKVGVEPFENKFDTWKEVMHYFKVVDNALDGVELENGIYDVLGVSAGDYYIQLYGDLGFEEREERWWIAYKYRDPDWTAWQGYEIQEGVVEDMYYCELGNKPPILKNLVWTLSGSKSYWGFGAFYKIDINYNTKKFNLINWINRNPMEVKE